MPKDPFKLKKKKKTCYIISIAIFFFFMIRSSHLIYLFTRNP